MDQKDIDQFEKKHMSTIMGILMVGLFVFTIVRIEWSSSVSRNSACEDAQLKANDSALKKTEKEDELGVKQC